MDFINMVTGPWRDVYVFVGFYQEQGGHAACIQSDQHGPRLFKYTSERDVLRKVSVERNIICAESGLDLLCWAKVGEGKVYWSLCEYMGFAIRFGANRFKIPI